MRWVRHQRVKENILKPEQKTILDSLGFDWDPHKNAWDNGFNHLEKYFQQEGHVRVPVIYISKDGYKLGNWVSNQRSNKNKVWKN